MAFSISTERKENEVELILSGHLDAANAPMLMDELKKLVGEELKKVTFMLHDLEYISSAGLRAIVFAAQKLGTGTAVHVVGANPDVLEVIEMTGFDSFLEIEKC